jgi:hypothetical protein
MADVLEKKIVRHISGVMRTHRRIEWGFGRKCGLGL